MKILVTGSSGYIGRFVCRAIRDAGHRVVPVDDLRNSTADPEFPPYQMNAGWIGNLISLEQPEVLIHLAADTRPDESFSDPTPYLGENVTVTQRIAEFAGEFGIKRIVFASSANIYEPQDYPIREDDPIAPNSPYGESKWIGERLLHWYGQVYGFTAVCLRFFNVVGGGHVSEHHLVPSILRAKAAGRPVQIFGNEYPTADGTCLRDFVHVEDVAQAHVKALTLPAGAYNVGTGQGTSVFDVVMALQAAYEFAPPRQGDPPLLVADSQKLQSYGWEPKYKQFIDMVAHLR